MELQLAETVSFKCLLLTSQVFPWRQIVLSSMFSLHTCLFPEDMRPGLDIQMRSGENFHLFALSCGIKKKEKEEKEADRVWETAESSQQLGPVWLWLGPVKVRCAGLKSPSCAAWIFWLVLLELICQPASNVPPSWGTHRAKSKIARTDSELSAVMWDCQGHSSGWNQGLF